MSQYSTGGWFTARELLGLPGVPSTVQGVNKRASKEQWVCRKREGERGGPAEYSIESLPQEAKAYLLRQSFFTPKHQSEHTLPLRTLPKVESLSTIPPATLNLVPEVEAIDLDDFEPGPDATKTELEISAKRWMIQAVRKYAERQAMTISDARWVFCDLYRSGQILAPSWVRETLKNKCSYQSLCGWEAKLKKDLKDLARQQGGGKKSKIEQCPEMRDLILGSLAQSPHLKPKSIYRILEVRFDGIKSRYPNAEMPSLRSLERWLKDWIESHPQEYAYMLDPKNWRSKYKPAFGSYTEGVEQLNDLWQLDSTRSDFIWELQDGRRYHVIGCIDVYSRRVKFIVSETSNSSAISSLLHWCLLHWGVPKRVKTDNGKDYVSNHIVNILAALGIEHELCTPYTPEQKPFIERVLGTLNHSIASEAHPLYIGASVAQRQQIRAREIWKDAPVNRDVSVIRTCKALNELQAYLDQWCDWYHQEPHEGLGKKRPLDMLAFQSVRTIDNPRLLDVLMMPAPDGGWRTIQKGGLRIDSNWYISADLAVIAERHPQVYVRLDPDLGTVHLFDGPDCAEYLGTAQCPELTGISRVEVAVKAQRSKRQLKAVVSGLKRIGKELDTASAAQEILDKASERMAKTRSIKGESEAYTSKGLEAASELLKGLDSQPRRSQPDSEMEQARREQEAERQQQLLAVEKPGEKTIDTWLRLAFNPAERTAPGWEEWMNNYVDWNGIECLYDLSPRLQRLLPESLKARILPEAQ